MNTDMRSTITLLILVVIVSVGVCAENDCGRLKSNSAVFPWNVGIYLGSENEAELVCLGSIIQSDAVLTAAHCFCDNIDTHLRNGTFYIMSDNSLPKKINPRSSPSNLHKVNKNSIHIHKHYKGIINFLENDLAIVKGRFNFNNKVKPICIDWSTEIVDTNSYGKQSVWHQNQVTNVEQTYVSPDDCYSTSKPFIPFITEDKSCTNLKTSGIPLSHESEGAALVFSHSDRWYIKGVISMHDVTKKQMSTYTPVTQYINWISNICATQ
ncbi:hypothetical protein Zmor_000925 [Zophobas morio]|uniref:Peptidase S1 domain-containing protein n=1 Tax=Zophobas morio TaxID=2755281 RepID=A0AA38J7F2_9CUCU|nr:hypothetical protein Zmor_000925 [Zophobas morio]